MAFLNFDQRAGELAAAPVPALAWFTEEHRYQLKCTFRFFGGAKPLIDQDGAAPSERTINPHLRSVFGCSWSARAMGRAGLGGSV